MVGAWGGYSNGRIPNSAMVQAEPGMYLQADAAASWNRMDAACPYALSINEAYRDYSTQQYYWGLYQSGNGNVAAYPGTSNHGWGLAVDINESGGPAFDWMISNGAAYGWSWATGRASGERWHWEYVGGVSGSGGSIAIINERLGAPYVTKLQTALGVGVDGDAGPETTKALQTKIGTDADGDFGPNSIRALQTFIGAGVDGDWGDETTAKFKAAIDAGKFGANGGGAGGADPDVLDAQQLLNKVGYHLDEDGIKGPATLAAIKDFQTKYGLDVDGIAGPATKAKIKEVIAGGGGTVVTPPTTDPATGLPDGYVYGVDLAWPQTGAFDWATFKKQNAFAIIKAAGAEDPAPNQIYGPANLTDQHLAGVRSVDLIGGFYFFNNGKLAVKPQADKFIEVVKARIKPGDIVALDIENDGDSVPPFNPAQALEFAGYVESALGIKTFIYINRSTMNNQDWSAVATAGHPLWLATLDGLADGLTYIKSSNVKWWSKASIVQWSSTTAADGYASPSIDRNFAELAALKANGFVKFPGTTTPPVDPPTDPEFDKADAIEELEEINTKVDDLLDKLKK